MKHTFTINGTTYTAAPFTFGLVADLEDLGFELSKIQTRPMSALRAYFAACIEDHPSADTLETASKELEEHIIAGGDLTELANAMGAEIKDSNFIQSMNKKKSSPKKVSKTTTAE